MIRQVIRFGVVGVTALMVNWLVVAVLVPTLDMAPLLANVFAFLVAFQVSYWGHRSWTFNAWTLRHSQTLPRFLVVSCSSFLINEFLYFLLLEFTVLDYRTALLIVLAIVAMSTFLLSRKWAFRKA